MQWQCGMTKQELNCLQKGDDEGGVKGGAYKAYELRCLHLAGAWKYNQLSKMPTASLCNEWGDPVEFDK